DQYMFGPAFMVSPVTRPLFTGTHANDEPKSREVYLPKGSWIDFWTGKVLEGGRSVAAAAGLDILPLYVRAGSIVPMGVHGPQRRMRFAAIHPPRITPNRRTTSSP
ncbi:MAG: hypothetical protein ABI983_09270, partial [Acidobacteriota bacterium]